MWIPVSQETIEDGYVPGGPWSRWMDAQVEFAMQPSRALTDEEQRTGWLFYTASNGETIQLAVGWRAEQQRRDDEARREAEMTACLFVACTCGHHTD